MKKILTFCTIFFALIVAHKVLFAHSYEPIHHNGKLTQPAQDIFAQLGENISTLEEANTFAQKNFIRKGERWDTQEMTPLRAKMIECAPVITHDLQKLQMIDAINPTQKAYTYALMLGALSTRMQERLDYLVSLAKDHTFEYVVLLSGARELQDIEKAHAPEHIKTEKELLVYLFEHSPLKDHPVIIIDAPMIQKADGTLARPTTDTTLEYFAQTAPKKGSCLVISNNPYVVRQTKVAQRIVGKNGFTIEGAGRANKEDALDSIMLLDEFARLVYEEYKSSQA